MEIDARNGRPTLLDRSAVGDFSRIFENSECLRSLEVIDFSRCGLSSESLNKLLSMVSPDVLRKLDLTGNLLQNDSVANIKKYLENPSCNLRLLNLSDNSLGSSSLMVIESLVKNAKLFSLDLSRNNITEDISCKFITPLSINSSLVHLDLSGNDLSFSTREAINTRLDVNTSVLHESRKMERKERFQLDSEDILSHLRHEYVISQCLERTSIEQRRVERLKNMQSSWVLEEGRRDIQEKDLIDSLLIEAEERKENKKKTKKKGKKGGKK